MQLTDFQLVLLVCPPRLHFFFRFMPSLMSSSSWLTAIAGDGIPGGRGIPPGGGGGGGPPPGGGGGGGGPPPESDRE